MSKLNILKEQPTEKNPYNVDNYPYGFRLRTKIRYWIETTSRGQRFVRQTLNPKTNAWNKPKKSTYNQIMLVGLNEDNHIKTTSLNMYCLKESQVYGEKYKAYFNKYQQDTFNAIIGLAEVYDKVEYTFKAKRYKNINTGEISTSINIFEMDQWKEINKNNEFIDVEEEEEKQRQKRIKLNRYALDNASVKSNKETAINTFKRCK
jgi:hypothetical protein